MSFARTVYTAALYVLLPFVRVRLALRARREPGYAEHIAERFGRYDTAPPREPVIWVHAVSVGETAAAEPLVRALQARFPGHRVLLTHMTPTGRRTGTAIFRDSVARAYLPYDFPFAVARFLDHYRPRIGLLMETEIWPNLIHACSARKVPIYLVNARLSEKSFRGYRRFASLVGESVAALSGIAAQSADDAKRFSALGAREVQVVGNVKFDAAPAAELVERGRAWRSAYAPRAVLLAASTREGEEALVLDAFERLATPALLVLVPRHPQRFDEVASLLEKRGMRYERRSSGRAVSEATQVLLGDSMGEMPAYYAASDVAFIGGSLLPFGAHNFIEACAVGTPVLLGPHTYNFAEAAERALDAGAALRVGDADELASTADRLLAEPAERLRMSEAALAFSRAYQGATTRIIDMLPLRTV
jgi:3-deoxy-D-manno-octulosonic-acid transferase